MRFLIDECILIASHSYIAFTPVLTQVQRSLLLNTFSQALIPDKCLALSPQVRAEPASAEIETVSLAEFLSAQAALEAAPAPASGGGGPAGDMLEPSDLHMQS